ncbi:MAG: 4-diphosphocytidyl-2-C-methyl-D-erythritol kinase [Planctomycetota bacterium]|jgi:4-diphosphocytidyl-2-C-methyl-D-erythritol kinase
MLLEKEGNVVRIQTPAKINLHLEVLNRRPDSYHDIETVMLAVSLCDELEVEKCEDSRITLDLVTPQKASRSNSSANHFDNDPAWDIPGDDQNLVVRALKRLREVLGVTSGAKIRLKKDIPAAAGLGGGSSDAAAALVAASLVWLGRFEREAVERVAGEIGSDLSFFLGAVNFPQSGLALCRGRGEKVSNLNLGGELWGVIAHPPAGCPTGQVYKNCEVPTVPRGSERLIEVLKLGTWKDLPSLLWNRLEPAASKVTPWVGKVAGWMDGLHVEAHLLSGSGSARFALCKNREQSTELAESLEKLGLQRVYVWQSFVTPSIEAQVEPWLAVLE